MAKNKSFFFDLDGTLLAKNKEISNATLQYLHKLKKNHKIGIATGRPSYMIKKEINQIKPDLPIISINGGLVTDKYGNCDNPIYMNLIDKKSQIEIIAKLKDLNLNFLLYTQDSMYYYDPNNNSPWCKWLHEMHNLRIDSEKWNFKPLLSTDENKIMAIKFLVLLENCDIKIKEKLNKFVEDHLKIWGVPSQAKVFDIMKLGVSKGKALTILEEKKHLRTNDLIVFGDAANDISMFEVANYSVAMKNATEKVKDSANSITNFSNDEDGVIKWLERNINEKSKN